jgi:hypothetical protein
LSKPFSLSSCQRRFNAKQLEERRRGVQDQDQGAVAGLDFDCKLIHFSNNKIILFPSQYMSYLWFGDPDLCRNTMKYRSTHKRRDAAEIRLHFINKKMTEICLQTECK